MLSADDNRVDLPWLDRAISRLPVFDGNLDLAFRSPALAHLNQHLAQARGMERVSGIQSAVPSLAYPKILPRSPALTYIPFLVEMHASDTLGSDC
jgi:hypothetical protein